MISDPVADMLTRIRNAVKAKHPAVAMPSSRLKVAIADVLKKNGYINDFAVEGELKKTLTISLRYTGKRKAPVIEGLRSISKPSCRVYVSTADIPRVLGGLGIVILSTSKGVMHGRAARQENVGGEVLCYVW